MNENQWDRREFDRKTRHEFIRQIDDLRDEMRKGLDRLGAEVDELTEYLRGGPNNKDPIGTRVHLVETEIHDLKQIVKGDALGRGSLIELTKQAASDAEAAKAIAAGKVEVRTVWRGQNVTVIVSVLSLLGVITVGTLSNWDRIERLFGKEESAVEWAERLREETSALQKTRGREVRAKLREIERAARGR